MGRAAERVARIAAPHLRVEQTLRESEERYRALVENSLQGIVVIQDWRFRFANTAAAAILGMPVRQILQLSADEAMALVFPEDRAAVRQRVEDRLAGKHVPPRREFRLRRKDGAAVWLDIFSSRIEFEGRPAIQIAFLNVTDRKRVEEALRRSERMQAEAEKLAATGRMAARVAHEINNPLAGIKSAFRLVRSAVPAGHPDRDMVGRIEREIDRITHVVRQMYRLHSPQATSIVDTGIAETIEDVLTMLNPFARKHGVRINLQSVPSELSVTAPVGSLQQIVYNLVANAVEASPEGAEVTISVESDDEHARLAVRDRGCGMSADVGRRVFDPFFTTKSGGTYETGMGLGLPIVKGIVDSLGGKVWFESAPGEGTLFQAVLPRIRPKKKGQGR